MIRKIWDERPTPATGRVGHTYLGTLRGRPSAGRRLVMSLDDRSTHTQRRLVTAPVVKLRGNQEAGLLYIETEASIYRVSLGQPCRPVRPSCETDVDERRSFPRVAVSAPVEVDFPVRRSRVGMLTDISGGGLQFRCASRFSIGELIELVIKMPNTMIASHVTGTVVRSGRDMNAGEWELPHQTAVSFDEPWTVG